MFPYASRYNSLLNICRYSCVNDRPFLPRSRRTSSTTTASCITHPSWFLLVRRLCPFALWTVISGLQIGRTSPRRLIRALRHPRARARVGDPTFITDIRIERDLGIPSVSLNTLTGCRSCAPEDYRRYFPTLRQGPAPVSCVFPAGDRLHLLETGLQEIRPLPYRAGLPARRSVRLGSDRRFPGVLLSLSPHGSG